MNLLKKMSKVENTGLKTLVGVMILVWNILPWGICAILFFIDTIPFNLVLGIAIAVAWNNLMWLIFYWCKWSNQNE